MVIQKLSPEVQSALRSGQTITDTLQCVIELVQNSLDAGSTSIAVRVDLDNLTIQVVDNGCGLTRNELDLIGNRYMTNKCHTLQDFQTKLDFYGFRGESLASLQESCGLLMIISKPKCSETTFCKVFRTNKKSQPATIAVHKRLCPGTTVIVKDFLLSLPVRKSRVQPAIEIEDIRHALIFLSIINCKVSFTLRNDVTKVVVLQTTEYADEGDALKHHCKTSKDHTLVPVTVSKSPFKLLSKISRQTETNYHFQMIFVNKRLVKNKIMYKIVNKGLEKSFYLNNTGNKDRGLQTEKCFPVYVINIICPHFEYDISSDPKKLQVEFRDWDIVTECLKETVAKFLATESQLNEVAPSLCECKDEKHKECEEQEHKECDNYQAKTNVVYTTLVTRNINNQNSFKNITTKPRCKQRAKEKPNKTKAECEGLLTKENDDKLNTNEISLASAETVPRIIVAENILDEQNKELCSKQHSVLRLTSGAQSVKHYNKIEQNSMSFVEYPLKSSSDQSFTFKMPNKLPLKRKLTEHILTESETDTSPVKPQFDSQLLSLRHQAEQVGCNTKISMLPIISEEFLNENLNNLASSRNAVFNVSTNENITPNQAIQINFYRSIKRHRKSNDLKLTHKQNVKFIDFDQGNFLNCSKTSQSSIQLEHKLLNNLSTTINQKNLLDNLQALTENISNTFNKDIDNRNLSLKEKQNKSRTITKEIAARNISKRPFAERYKSIQIKRSRYRSKRNVIPQNNVNFHNSTKLCEASENWHPQVQCDIINPYLTKPLRHCINTDITEKLSKQQLVSNGFNGLSTEADNWGGVGNSPLYHNYRPLSFTKSPFNILSKPEGRVHPRVTFSHNYREIDVNGKVCDELRSGNINNTTLKLEECNTENNALIPICHKFQKLSLKGESVNSKHFPNNYYAANSKIFEFSNEDKSDFQLGFSHVLKSSSSEQFSYDLNSPCSHTLSPQMKCMMAPDHTETEIRSLTPVNPHKLNTTPSFDKVISDSSPNRQLCNDQFQGVSPPSKQICLTESNRAVPHSFRSTNTHFFNNISKQSQTATYNGHENHQHNSYTNECFTTNNSALHFVNSKSQENTLYWNEENTPHGEKIFINSISGMSSFNKPEIQSHVSIPFKLQSRHWFMPKGISPLLRMTVSDGENIAELTSREKYIMEAIIQPMHSVDLATVKWKTSQHNGSILPHMIQSEVLNMSSKPILQKSCRFSGESLKLSKVLGQVDDKFIAACLKPNGEDNDFLILFDQHAVDERIRVETLLSGYKHPDGQLISQSINPQIEVPLSDMETAILNSISSKLPKLGLKIDIEERKVTVAEVPLCLFNQAAKEKPDGNQLLPKMVTILIKQILVFAEDFRGLMPSSLPFVQDIINSEACRGAIKFGDTLNIEKCKMLISKLALCETPFQCAHGRPVLAPLLEIEPPKTQESKINFSNLEKRPRKQATFSFTNLD